MIRVVVADDSAFTRQLLTTFLEESGECRVIAHVSDARRVADTVADLQPDVLTLDLLMPGADGLVTLQQITRSRPTPVVVVTGVTRHAAAVTVRALQMGAVDVVLKFTPNVVTRPETLRREIVAKVRAAASARVGGYVSKPEAARPSANRIPQRRTHVSTGTGPVVIGASTGGPAAVGDLLAELPRGYRRPVVVVQHLPPALTPVFAAQLDARGPLPVAEAQPGGSLQPGRVLVAPGAFHLVMRPDARFDLQPVLVSDPYRPSIDRTMLSAAATYGRDCIGVVLTGMGSDGADGLAAIGAQGGATFVQATRSCVVDGMPRRAMERALVCLIASPKELGLALAGGCR